MLRSIELHNAFVWDCDECGRENFERSIPCDNLTEQELEELRDEHGIEAYEAGRFELAPVDVTCKYCETKFITE